MDLLTKIRPVDVSKALRALDGMVFADTGGTNGWLADPAPLMGFVNGIGIEGKIFRVNCRKLPARQGIPPHIDHKTRVRERRFHVPLVTHPDVTMRWPEDNFEAHLELGWLYEVRFDRLHEIVHRADVDRIHLQVNVTWYGYA